MGDGVKLSQAELALILEALDDAAYYRETRSRVLESSVRRASRRGAPVTADSGGGTDANRLKAHAYGALAVNLKAAARRLKSGS